MKPYKKEFLVILAVTILLDVLGIIIDSDKTNSSFWVNSVDFLIMTVLLFPISCLVYCSGKGVYLTIEYLLRKALFYK
jgi:hypothetical protein